ncbi:hypothetical protein QEV61_04610 [Trueperella pyogenes]|uniref:hypothetical protein n=1 Tax=Trueperella pyogenes TaxID=1661 RepID=UPI00324DAEEC
MGNVQGRPGRVRTVARWEDPDCARVQINAHTMGRGGVNRACVLDRGQVVPFGQAARRRGDFTTRNITVHKGQVAIGGLNLSKLATLNLLINLARLLQQAADVTVAETEIYAPFVEYETLTSPTAVQEWHTQNSLFSHQEGGKY